MYVFLSGVVSIVTTINYNNQRVKLLPELTLIMGVANSGKSTLLSSIREQLPQDQITRDAEWARDHVRTYTLMDEPTAQDMTAGSVWRIRQKIIDNLRPECYTIMVTHSVADIMMAPRVLYLENRQIVLDESGWDFLWNDRARNYLQNRTDFH